MAKLFIGIALALMVATAFLGFLAKGNIDKMRSGFTAAKGELQREQASLQTAKNELKKAVDDLGMANDKIKESSEALTAKATELSTKDQQLTAAQKEVETQTAEVARLKAFVAAQPNQPPGPGGPTPEVVALTEQLQKAQLEIAEAKKLVEIQADQGRANEIKITDMLAREKKRGDVLGLAGLQGKILAVNPGWNFVVLSVGDKQGVSVNAPLLVVRGNTPIARLRITSVEAAKSIADVI